MIITPEQDLLSTRTDSVSAEPHDFHSQSSMQDTNYQRGLLGDLYSDMFKTPMPQNLLFSAPKIEEDSTKVIEKEDKPGA